MAKLTHIDDIERERAAQAEEREMQAAQEALLSQKAEGAAADTRVRAAADTRAGEDTSTTDDRGPELDVTEQAVKDSLERTAAEEADFHGLDSDESMSGMQKALIVLAVIVFVAAILYLVNSWVHFV